MLEVLSVQEKERQEVLCDLCHVPYRPETMAYSAVRDGDFRGICQFTMNADGGKLVDFAWVPEKYDFETFFILGRGVLNFIDLCGVHRAFFDADCDNETLIKAIGFSKNAEGRWEMDLTGFFYDPCKHSKKKDFIPEL